MKFKFIDVRPSVIAAAAIAVTLAGFKKLEGARLAIQECDCSEVRSLADSMRTMVAYAERFVGEMNSADGGIRALMGSMEFNFEINAILPSEEGRCSRAK
jgi:hypothetical protein